METASNPTLALTYAADGNQDGAGAQLLRIYGIYAISRFLRVPYVHSPIAVLGYHGFTALENNAPSANLLEEFNRVFRIPSDLDLPAHRVIHNMLDADVESIERIKNAGSDDREFNLIRILYPFPVTDIDPEIYRCVKAISPFPYSKSEVFRLAIHVRRGELFAIDSHRMLPNSYYVSAALRFQRILSRLDIPFVCELYTEAASKRFEVTPQHHGIFGRISDNIVFDPAMNHLEDFDAIPNLETFINTDPIDALRRMATADALILSRSCFSFLAAILSANCIVLYYPVCYGPMQEWLVSDESGNIPEADLIRRLGSWKRGRSETEKFGAVTTAGNGLPVAKRARSGQTIHAIEMVHQEREAIVGIAAAHGAAHLRLIASVSRGEARVDSDIDLLVMWREGTRSVDQAALKWKLENLLDRKINIVSHDGSDDGMDNGFYRDIVRRRILQTAPVTGTTDPACELHALTCRGDWLNLIWSLKSFYHFSERHYSLCIHDDGTVPALGIEQLRRMFPEARLIRRPDADARAEIELRNYPRCLEFRRRHPFAPKIFDFTAFLESDRMLLFDSDLLFFKEPTALLERIENPAYRRNTFNGDCENGYTVRPEAVRGPIGHELLPLINTGLGLVHKGSLRADWCEEFLGLPDLLGGPFWSNEEQTLIALCSSRFGAELLPDEYTRYLGRGIGSRPFRHYIGRVRDPLMYVEGIRQLVHQNFLPWHFVILLEAAIH